MANITQCPACGSDLGLEAPAGLCPQCTSAAAQVASSSAQAATPTFAASDATQHESLQDVIFADQVTEPLEDQAGTAHIQPGLPPSLRGYMIIGPPMRGGMGTVWPAKQLGTRRTVAIKILGTQHLTAAGRARFEREVELSAQLQHPNIARIYESGIHQGDYYYAMEMIDGLPLDRHVAKNKPGQKQILEMMRLICLGVQHAHVRGMIHCDLKPANIMVSEDSQPHVLDFGLARLTTGRPDGLTENGSAPGTPSYMSPEQAAGKLEQIDTRSDVYTLGKIFYELLTGKLPHRVDGPITEVLRRIATEDVCPPRKALPKLSRELAAILLKALDRDPERRYSVAGELARDIEHYQRGHPVAAVRVSIIYQLRKWMGRHRLSVAIAATACVVLIFVGVVSLIRIAQETARTRLLNEFSNGVLEAIDPANNVGKDMTEQLSERARKLSATFDGDPRMRANLTEKIANILYTFGQLAPAEEQYQVVAQLREKELGIADEKTLAVKERLAQVTRERGKFDEALDWCNQVLRTRTTKSGKENRQTLMAQVALAQVLEDKSLLGADPTAIGKAESLLKETIAKCETVLGHNHVDTLTAKAALVLVLAVQKGERLAEADRLSQEVLAARRLILRENHRQIFESMHDRAIVLTKLGQLNSAIELYRKALDGASRFGGWSSPGAPASAEHPDLLIWWNDIGYALAARGEVNPEHDDIADAQKIFVSILDLSKTARGLDHPFNVVIQQNLAATYVAQGNWTEAERLFAEAVNIHERNLGADHLETIRLLDLQAWALTGMGKRSQAVKIYEHTLNVRREKLAPDDPAIKASIERLEKAQPRLRAAQTLPTTQP